MHSTSFRVSSSSSTCKIRITLAPQVNTVDTQVRVGAERSPTLKLRSRRRDAHEHLLRTVRSSVGQIAHVTTRREISRWIVWGKFLPCRSAAIQKRTAALEISRARLVVLVSSGSQDFFEGWEEQSRPGTEAAFVLSEQILQSCAAETRTGAENLISFQVNVVDAHFPGLNTTHHLFEVFVFDL